MRVGIGVAVAVLALTSCTRLVDGTVQPAAGLAPQPLSGRTVKQVLLDDAELSKMFGRSFQSDPEFSPRYGNGDDLPDAWASGTPHDCVGAAVAMQKSVYPLDDVQDVAEEYWKDTGRSGLVINEGVVALATAAAADQLFEEFSRQWQQCDGTTVDRNDLRQAEATGKITGVEAVDSLLTASVRTVVSGNSGLLVARALGVRVNCVVDVEVLYLASDPSPADREKMAIEVARAMSGKVSKLS